MLEHDAFDRRFAEALSAYAAEAPTDVDPVDLARAVADAHPRRAGRWAAFGVRGGMRPLLLLATLAALLLATVVALLVVGSLIPDKDLAQRPLAIESVGIGGWGEPVAAGDGTIWSFGNSGVSVYDPANDSVRLLGVGDDPVFARSAPLAAAAAGGVWLQDAIGGRIARAADGRIAEALPALDVCRLSNDTDLIAISCDGTIERWDGEAWTAASDPLPGAPRVASFAHTPDGSWWVITMGDQGISSLWQNVGRAWVRQGDDLAFDPQRLAAGPDGSIWVAGGDGLAKRDELAWRSFAATQSGVGDTGSMAVAADGTVWTAAIADDAATAVGFDGTSRVTFPIPIAPSFGPQRATIIATPAGVFVSVWGALARLAADRFEVVDAGPPERLQMVQSIGVDADGRAWTFAGGEGTGVPVWLGRVDGGAYAEDPLNLGSSLQAADLQEGADGGLWLASTTGPRRFDGDSFELVGPPLDLEAGTSGISFDGASIILPPYAIGPDGTPYTITTGAPCDSTDGTTECGADDRVLRLAGDAWQELPAHPGVADGTRELAVAPDGAVWVATGRVPGPVGLARFHDGRWESVPLPDRGVSDVSGITFDRDGAAWIRLWLGDDTSCACWSQAVARLVSTAWTVFEDVDGTPFGRAPTERNFPELVYHDIVVDRQGVAFVNADEGIARFGDGRWTWALKGVYGLRHLTLGLDGSIWAAGTGVHRIVAAAGGR